MGVGRGVRFNVLGALEVWAGDERIHLGGPKAERLLAALLLEPRRVVPVNRLVDAVWEYEPPSTAAHRVRKSVAELRKRIPGGGDLFVTSGPGYLIDVVEEQVDALLFQALCEQSVEAETGGDGPLAVALVQRALALWRGDVLAGEGSPAVEADVRSLEEQRMSAIERLYGLRLSLEDASASVPGLRELTERHPYQENLRGLLMVALYKAGRQAEALEEYTRARHLLDQELALLPGPELNRLHESILRGDLELPTTQPEFTLPAIVVEHPSPDTLPYDLDDFAGRETEIDRILGAARREAVNGPRVVAISGMGGVGKTALAVHVARSLAPDYPDGRLFADLHGFTSGHQPERTDHVLDVLLHSLGIPSESIPTNLDGKVAAWRVATANRRLLLVLDNVVSAQQVLPLVPASSGCLLLVTSRNRLTGLDSAVPLSLEPFGEVDGSAMIRSVLGEAWTGEKSTAVADLVHACGGLPLALRIATARLRHRVHWNIDHLVARLAQASTPLAELSSGERSVTANLSLSYQALREEQRRAFRLLGVHPGSDLDIDSAAALLRIPVLQAERILEHLLDVHLVQQQQRNRYVFHDLVRSFAGTLRSQETQQEEAAALENLLHYYSRAADAAGAVLFPGRASYPWEGSTCQSPCTFASADAALRWFSLNRANLVASVHSAYTCGLDRQTAIIARSLTAFLRLQDFYADAFAMGEESVLAAERLGDQTLIRLSLTNHALGYWDRGEPEKGIDLLKRALAIATELKDRPAQARCLTRLGLFLNASGDPRQGLLGLHEALACHQELGDLREEALTLTYISDARNLLCDHAAAAAAARAALDIARRLGDVKGEVVALLDLAGAHAGLSYWRESVECLETAELLCQRLGTRSLQQLIVAKKALGLCGLGRLEEADAEISRITAAPAPGTERPDGRQAAIENIVGFVLNNLGRQREALGRHERALALAAADRHERAIALDAMSQMLEALGHADRASQCRSDAATLMEQIGVDRCACRT